MIDSVTRTSGEILTFEPNRRWGLVTHAVLILVFIIIGSYGLWRAANADIGPLFLLYLLPALLAVIIVPILAYRVYALMVAYYQLERDGIRVRWGLRIEEIPMDVVLQVIPADSYTGRLPMPWLRIPGAVLGRRQLPGNREIEYLASTVHHLILIEGSGGMIAISPADSPGFLEAYRYFTELGTLTPIAGRSVFPTFLISVVWQKRLARVLILAGFAVSILLLVWSVLAVPTRDQVSLGFFANGTPGELVPAVRLMLLPVIGIFFFVADLIFGLFLYRRQDTQFLSIMLWVFGVLTPLLMLVGVIMILNVGI